MRKSTIFISAVLTTFALAILYNVVSAYRDLSAVSQTASQTSEVMVTAEPTDLSAPTPMSVTPEQAAQLAAQVVGQTNLLSAESSNINGVDAYKITFTNNDVVYVGLDGQILSVQVAPVVVNVAQPVAKTKDKNNNGGNGGQVSNQENHDQHDD